MAAPLAATVGEGGLIVPAGVGGGGAGEMTGDEVLKPAGNTTGTTFAGEGMGVGAGAGMGTGVGAALGGGVSAEVGAAVLAGVGEGLVAAATGGVDQAVDDKVGTVVGRKGMGQEEGGVLAGGGGVVESLLLMLQVIQLLCNSRSRQMEQAESTRRKLAFGKGVGKGSVEEHDGVSARVSEGGCAGAGVGVSRAVKAGNEESRSTSQHAAW